MPTLSGNISGSIKSTALNISCRIKSFSLVNKTTGSVVGRIGVVISSQDRYFYDTLLTALGTVGSSYLVKTDIEVPANIQILIVTSASAPGIDYVITYE